MNFLQNITFMHQTSDKIFENFSPRRFSAVHAVYGYATVSAYQQSLWWSSECILGDSLFVYSLPPLHISMHTPTHVFMHVYMHVCMPHTHNTYGNYTLSLGRLPSTLQYGKNVTILLSYCWRQMLTQTCQSRCSTHTTHSSHGDMNQTLCMPVMNYTYHYLHDEWVWFVTFNAQNRTLTY